MEVKMGETIRRALVDQGLSQKELAEMMHVTPQAVSKWIRGESRPTQDNVAKIYEILGVDLTKEMVKKERKHCSNDNMKHRELDQITNYELAKEEAALILKETGIASKYSHSVYTLLSWLVPAVIGLTHHQLVNAKEDDEVDYSCIIDNLSELIDDENCPYKIRDHYGNYLSYNFYLMGMDLFESFDVYTISDHDYCSAAMDDWYNFKAAFVNSLVSPIYCELRVAVAEMIALL